MTAIAEADSFRCLDCFSKINTRREINILINSRYHNVYICPICGLLHFDNGRRVIYPKKQKQAKVFIIEEEFIFKS